MANFSRFMKQSVELSGVNCRDSQGEFVPVPQCRRKPPKRKA